MGTSYALMFSIISRCTCCDVKSTPGGPARKEAHHLPSGHCGTIQAQGSSGRLLGASAARNPQSTEKQKQATWEALFYLLHRSQGKNKRTFPAPTPPLTCIFSTTSIITTNTYNKRQIETLVCSHDDQRQKEISHSEDPEEKLKSTHLHEHQLTLSMSRTHTAPAAEEGQCCEVRAAHLSTADTKRSSSCRLW